MHEIYTTTAGGVLTVEPLPTSSGDWSLGVDVTGPSSGWMWVGEGQYRWYCQKPAEGLFEGGVVRTLHGARSMVGKARKRMGMA